MMLRPREQVHEPPSQAWHRCRWRRSRPGSFELPPLRQFARL